MILTGQSGGSEIGGQQCRKVGLASALMGERQQRDHQAA
jgi:hypothetical protein